MKKTENKTKVKVNPSTIQSLTDARWKSAYHLICHNFPLSLEEIKLAKNYLQKCASKEKRVRLLKRRCSRDQEIEKLKEENNKLIKANLKKEREYYIATEMKKWQLKSFIPATICSFTLVSVLGLNNWSLDFMPTILSSSAIGFVNVFCYVHIHNRFFNESIKKAFCERLKIPPELQD